MATLHVQTRAATTASNPRKLRAQGILPMALVEKGKGTQLIQAEIEELRRVLNEAKGLSRFNVIFDGEKVERQVVIKQVDRDAVSRKVLHLTLMEVSDKDLIEMDVTIEAEGIPLAVDNNQATLECPTRTIRVRGRVSAIPELITIDVSGFDVGDSVSASDIPLPKGVELASSADATIFVVQALRAAVTSDSDADAAATETSETSDATNEEVTA